MIYKGTILSIRDKTSVKIRLEEGSEVGKEIVINASALLNSSQVSVNEGDVVMVSYSPGKNGVQIGYIADFYRNDALLILSVLFILVVAWIGRMRGILSILGMIFSFFVVAKVLLPSILGGSDPVVVMLLGSLVIIPVTFYISHGITKKTTIAVISTFIALLVTGLLSYLFVLLAKLTGFSAEESIFLQAQGLQVNMRSILLAGILLGAMGVLDDITISQVSIVETLRRTNRSLSRNELYKHAMNVGRDHISSLVNTLFLVYAGASLPLFLLFYSHSLATGMIINQEVVATEIVRTLVSSIGIILSVPLATFIASFQFTKD